MKRLDLVTLRTMTTPSRNDPKTGLRGVIHIILEAGPGDLFTVQPLAMVGGNEGKVRVPAAELVKHKRVNS